MRARYLFLISLLLLFTSSAFAQVPSAFSDAFSQIGTTLSSLIEGFRTPESLVLAARIFAFVIVLAITNSMGGFVSRGGRQAGFQNGARVFGFVVAIATQLLAPDGYLLAFMFFAGILGQVLLTIAALFFVRQMISGEDEETGKMGKVIKGLVWLMLGTFFLFMGTVFGYEQMSEIITRGGYIIPQDIMDGLSSFGSWASLINLVPIFAGGAELLSAFGGLKGLAVLGAGTATLGAAAVYAKGADKENKEAQKNLNNMRKDLNTLGNPKANANQRQQAAQRAIPLLQSELDRARQNLNELNLDIEEEEQGTQPEEGEE